MMTQTERDFNKTCRTGDNKCVPISKARGVGGVGRGGGGGEGGGNTLAASFIFSIISNGPFYIN